MSDGSDAMIERRLLDWGAWLARGRMSAEGYPTKSVLHQSWLPPTAGTTPTMHGGAGDRQERAMHRLIGGLSVRLSNTLVVSYVLRLKGEERALRLQCQESTARARVAEAKRLLLCSMREQEPG